MANRFEMAGWRALFLSADTPAEDLVRGIEDLQADLVALSTGLGLHLGATARVVDSIRASSRPVPTLVGGGPFHSLSDLWRKVRADGSAADAEGAVEAGARLVGP